MNLTRKKFDPSQYEVLILKPTKAEVFAHLAIGGAIRWFYAGEFDSFWEYWRIRNNQFECAAGAGAEEAYSEWHVISYLEFESGDNIQTLRYAPKKTQRRNNDEPV